MTADHRGESGQQRTVAELLKQYGADESSNGRRRRRAAEPDEPPGIAPAQRSVEQDSAYDGVDDYPAGGADQVSGSGGYLAGGDTSGPAVSGSGSFEAAFDYDRGVDRDANRDVSRDFDRDFDYDRPSATGGYPAAGGYDAPGYGSSGFGSAPPAQPAGAAPPNTGSFPAQAYRGDIYQGGSSGPPTSPGLVGNGLGISGREESTDFIPRYGSPDTPAPETRGPDTPAPETRGPDTRDARSEPGVLDSGPHTAVSSRAEMFDDEDDDGGPSTAVSSRAEMFDDDEDDGGPSTAVSSRAEMFDDEDDEPEAQAEPADQPAPASGFLGRRLRRSKPTPVESADDAEDGEPAEDLFSTGSRATSAIPATSSDVEDGELPAGLTDEDDPTSVAEDGEPSPVKAWLMLIGQLVFATVLGAALWIGFRYLWLNMPVVALGAAVLATAGLVLLVRAIRRSDDLQTTMLAVLVGLVVTISPAVLLLNDR